jgi:hypothetical protein
MVLGVINFIVDVTTIVVIVFVFGVLRKEYLES